MMYALNFACVGKGNLSVRVQNVATTSRDQVTNCEVSVQSAIVQQLHIVDHAALPKNNRDQANMMSDGVTADEPI